MTVLRNVMAAGDRRIVRAFAVTFAALAVLLGLFNTAYTFSTRGAVNNANAAAQMAQAAADRADQATIALQNIALHQCTRVQYLRDDVNALAAAQHFSYLESGAAETQLTGQAPPAARRLLRRVAADLRRRAATAMFAPATDCRRSIVDPSYRPPRRRAFRGP